MRTLYENLPEVEIGGRRLVGRVLLGLLVLVSVLVGTTAGLLLVYTTDLPQVDALEAYRPSSITEIYDDHGVVIGSFTLDANRIDLGNGVYGFEAASEFYFSKTAKQLTLPEAALLAGLPKGPTYYSPINHPDRAVKRRNLVINAMLEDGKITNAQADDARSAPLVLHVAHDPNSLAPYFVEEIRRYLEGKYGTDQVHEGGLKVYTSLDVDMQKAANQAVLDGLAAYERRHGWKNHLENIIAEGIEPAKYFNSDWDDEQQVNGYVHALITSAGTGIATLKFGPYTAALGQTDVAWTGQNVAKILKAGDICYV